MSPSSRTCIQPGLEVSTRTTASYLPHGRHVDDGAARNETANLGAHGRHGDLDDLIPPLDGCPLFRPERHGADGRTDPHCHDTLLHVDRNLGLVATALAVNDDPIGEVLLHPLWCSAGAVDTQGYPRLPVPGVTAAVTRL